VNTYSEVAISADIVKATDFLIPEPGGPLHVINVLVDHDVEVHRADAILMDAVTAE
jgi:hypothetical protein